MRLWRGAVGAYVAVALGLALCACAPESEPRNGSGDEAAAESAGERPGEPNRSAPSATLGAAAPAPEAARRADAPLAAVLAPELARAGAAPDVSAYQGTPDPEAAELLAFVRAMAEAVARDAGAMDAVARDVRSEGAAVVRALVTLALDPNQEAEVRAAAVGLLPATGAPEAADALVQVAAASGPGGTEPWLRRLALWRVREVAAGDGALLSLILRLKYETDDEARVWLAGSLARFGVFAGVEDLIRLAAGSAPARAAASEELQSVVAAAGNASAEALAAAWRGAPALEEEFQAFGSQALRAAVWRAIAELSGERFQLRGVDDARYALSRLPAEAAPELARALGDTDPFVRLHVAQVLERMGPRAALALGALTERLADPHTGVAAAAAEALGAVGRGVGPTARAAATEALVPLTAAGLPHELRVAAVRGLGRLVDPAQGERLLRMAAEQTLDQDLRLAAAEGAVALGLGEPLVPYLLERLADPLGDAGAAESLLAAYLEQRAAGPRSGAARAAWDLWRALGPPFERVHTPEEVRLRRRARAALVTGLGAP